MENEIGRSNLTLKLGYWTVRLTPLRRKYLSKWCRFFARSMDLESGREKASLGWRATGSNLDRMLELEVQQTRLQFSSGVIYDHPKVRGGGWQESSDTKRDEIRQECHPEMRKWSTSTQGALTAGHRCTRVRASVTSLYTCGLVTRRQKG